MEQVKTRFFRVIKTKFIFNTSWIVGERVYQILLNLFITIFVARYLGPENYGILNYGASFIAFFLPLSSLGLEGVIIKELVKDSNDEGVIVGTSILMRFFASILSMISILVLIYSLNSNDSLIVKVAFIQSVTLIFKSVQIIEFWYQSKLMSKYSSIIKGIAYTIMSSYKIVLLIFSKNVLWFAFATALDSIVIAMLFLYSYNKASSKKIRFSFSTAKLLFYQSHHFILSGMIVAVYNQIDKIMIGQILNQTEVGFYSVAVAICGMWTFIPQAFINSGRPIIMKLKDVNPNQYLTRLKQLYFFIFWLGVLFAIFISVFSKPIILILYGSDFLNARIPLLISVWYTIFATLGVARGVWILSENKNSYVKKYLFWGSVLNLVLNFLLISRIGINGAAISTLITQIFTAFIAPLLYKETRVHTKILLEAIIYRF